MRLVRSVTSSTDCMKERSGVMRSASKAAVSAAPPSCWRATCTTSSTAVRVAGVTVETMVTRTLFMAAGSAPLAAASFCRRARDCCLPEMSSTVRVLSALFTSAAVAASPTIRVASWAAAVAVSLLVRSLTRAALSASGRAPLDSPRASAVVRSWRSATSFVASICSSCVRRLSPFVLFARAVSTSRPTLVGLLEMVRLTDCLMRLCTAAAFSLAMALPLVMYSTMAALMSRMLHSSRSGRFLNSSTLAIAASFAATAAALASSIFVPSVLTKSSPSSIVRLTSERAGPSSRPVALESVESAGGSSWASVDGSKPTALRQELPPLLLLEVGEGVAGVGAGVVRGAFPHKADTDASGTVTLHVQNFLATPPPVSELQTAPSSAQEATPTLPPPPASIKASLANEFPQPLPSLMPNLNWRSSPGTYSRVSHSLFLLPPFGSLMA
mmetsp:Transcript_15709/g.43950  ORF Transcript_15709/g.43950 Transcript_15709/m.43950 type:complete len:442 (+) Transcript_15709:384-1709(+)